MRPRGAKGLEDRVQLRFIVLDVFEHIDVNGCIRRFHLCVSRSVHRESRTDAGAQVPAESIGPRSLISLEWRLMVQEPTGVAGRRSSANTSTRRPWRRDLYPDTRCALLSAETGPASVLP